MKLSSNKLFGLNFATSPIPNISKYILNHPPQTILPTSMADITLCHNNPDIFKKIQSFSIRTMDGMPLVFLARTKTKHHLFRGYGPDLTIQIFKDSQTTKAKHFLYGGTPELLPKLKANLLKIAPQAKIVGIYSPPFRPLNQSEKNDVIQKINRSQANIIWIGLGSLKQIEFINEFSQIFPNKTFLAVGAAFDFISQTKKQAPLWMQNFGLEWLFRLFQEPQRLFKRYILSLPQASYLFLKEYFSIKINPCLKKS